MLGFGVEGRGLRVESVVFSVECLRVFRFYGLWFKVSSGFGM
jgi:hypothetical protein